MMVRPSEHLRPALVAQPPKSASITAILTVSLLLPEVGCCRLRRSRCGWFRHRRFGSSGLRHVAVDELIRLRVLGRPEADTLSDLISGKNLVARELIGDLGDLLHRDELERVAEVHDRLLLRSGRLRQE